jgi:hypothetical protein
MQFYHYAKGHYYCYARYGTEARSHSRNISSRSMCSLFVSKNNIKLWLNGDRNYFTLNNRLYCYHLYKICKSNERFVLEAIS